MTGKCAIAIAMAAALASMAGELHIEVPPMTPEYADTEVSTNISFNVLRTDMRNLDMRFTFDGVPSNCVQVAFGRDADGDGRLSFDETDAVYGWRNGRYFAEDVRTRVRTEEPEPATGRALTVRMRLTKDARADMFAATNGTGTAVLGDLASSVPEWLCRPGWNMMRVTRRGPGVPAEWFVCDGRYGYTYFIIR